MRLLTENNVSDPKSIKGTGVRGMLTKGDVLAHLGKASHPLGTYKAFKRTPEWVTMQEAKPVAQVRGRSVWSVGVG